MDMHIDMKVGFGEDFALDNQGLSCASTTGSFSSASTSSSLPEPFTPTSGRSTPGLRSISMEQDHLSYPASAGFELTPPSSAFGGYFPPEAKAEFHRYMDYGSASPSPSRKSSMQAQTMDFDYAPIMPTAFVPLSSQGHPLEAASNQHLGHYPYPEYVQSPQYPVPTPAYPLENTTCDSSSIWAWNGESPVSFFGRGNPSASPSPSHSLSARDRSGLTPSYLASHGKRRVNVDKVQQKTSALQRAQHQHGVRIERIAAATFKCNYPNCQKGPFKRQEHLKRHKNTKHAENPVAIITNCPCCGRAFNRKDNYRQHLKLHTLKQRSTRRTEYYANAQALLDEEMNKTKQRSQLKKKGSGFKDEDE
ncbi:hypothetical protein F5Y04DRAFT_293045 [Hypomontagnella monticulosa]|nr:hypothetical protein F5Y04DRAFT_293045 [Hypomontagnella monticulosa]